MTQRARIEYALNGGRINTDAIDNSAGVDTSDHEVNIKIGVDDADCCRPHRAERSRARSSRRMTDEVEALGAGGQLPADAGDHAGRGGGARPAGSARRA